LIPGILELIVGKNAIVIIGIVGGLFLAYIAPVAFHLYMCFFYLVNRGRFAQRGKVWYFVGLKGDDRNKKSLVMQVSGPPQRVYKFKKNANNNAFMEKGRENQETIINRRQNI
jgi:hypothetical protein